ncbi:hypothetical protein D3C77_179780 [compost metagenome]
MPVVSTLVPWTLSWAPGLREARAWGKVRLEEIGEPLPVVVTEPPYRVTVALVSATTPMALSSPAVVMLRLRATTVELPALRPVE